MYAVSETIQDIINSDDRSIEWHGTITLKDGTTREFDTANIVQGSGSVKWACETPGIGGIFARELSIKLFLDIAVQLLVLTIYLLQAL